MPQRRAEAGVGVDQQRQRRGGGDAAGVFGDIVQVGDAEVGQPERGIRHAGAGEIERAKPGPLGEQRGVGVDHADDLQRPFGFDCVEESEAGGQVVGSLLDRREIFRTRGAESQADDRLTR